jgi:hypothetical protein
MQRDQRSVTGQKMGISTRQLGSAGPEMSHLSHLFIDTSEHDFLVIFFIPKALTNNKPARMIPSS